MCVEVGVVGQQAPLVPARVAVRPEKVGAHVVVNAVNLPAALAIFAHYFAANEPTRARYEDFFHKKVLGKEEALG